MKYLMLIMLLVTIFTGGCSPASTATSEPTATPGATATLTPPPVPTVAKISPVNTPVPTAAQGDTQLQMVLIRAESQLEVQKLRRMNLDIVRVKAVESNETPDSKEALRQGEYLIEAVVSPGQLAKLKSLGFHVTELP